MMIHDVDEAFCEIVERPSSRLRGHSIYDLTHPDDLPANRRLLDKLRGKNQAFSITKRYVRDDGAAVWVRNHVSRLTTSNNDMRLLATIQLIDPPLTCVANDLTIIAEKILAVRQSRSAIFDDHIFGEPDYEVLLDLFVNEQRGRAVSVSSACIAACVPPTTALRHIARLVSSGWITRTADLEDRRRANLALSPRGLTHVQRYLEECERARLSL